MKLAFIYPKRFTIYPPDYLDRGLGGTESLFVTLTRELVKIGHEVVVYANTYKEDTYDGVSWKSIWRTSTDDNEYDFKVILRYLEAFDYPIKSKKTILWSHDNFYDEKRINYYFEKKLLDKIVVVSKYHRSITINSLPNQIDNIIEVPNSYDNYLYNKFKNIEKVKYKCIYCSVPIRGLNYLLEIWDEVTKILPEAKLYITSDMTLWGSTKQDDRHVMNELYLSLDSRKNIVRLGNIPKEEVAYHQATSELMLYPTDFDELFCISALECLSVKTPVVSTYRAGLIERVQENNGKLIKGNPDTEHYKAEFLEESLKLLQNRDLLHDFQTAAQNNVDQYSIEHIALIWDNLFKKLI